MRRLLAPILVLLLAGCLQASPEDPTPTPTPSAPATAECTAPGFAPRDLNATIATSAGEIGIVLYAERSPVTVCNFLHYIASDFYDGTIFHRICAHVIQAGGYDPYTMMQKPGRPPIKNEANVSQYRNDQGTLGMARTADPDSATSHFFINNRDNNYLDFDSERPGVAPGYAVFGNVTRGWDVAQTIAATLVLPEPDDVTSEVAGTPDGCQGVPVPSRETTIVDVRLEP
jgi:cyclophilin family peptidyl-prolyl cis-trans isomerase